MHLSALADMNEVVIGNKGTHVRTHMHVYAAMRSRAR